MYDNELGAEITGLLEKKSPHVESSSHLSELMVGAVIIEVGNLFLHSEGRLSAKAPTRFQQNMETMISHA